MRTENRNWQEIGDKNIGVRVRRRCREMEWAEFSKKFKQLVDTYRQHRDSRLGFSLGRCLSGTCTILYRTPGLPWCADTMSGARCASHRCGGSSWSRDCGLLRLFVCPRVATPPTDNDTNSIAERTQRNTRSGQFVIFMSALLLAAVERTNTN